MKIRKLVIIIFTILLCVFSIPAYCEEDYEIDKNKLDNYLEEAQNESRIPELSIIVSSNKENYTYNNSKNNLEIDEFTPYIIASVSKSFTSIAIIQLIDMNLLEFNSKVKDIIPYFEINDKEYESEITVEQLLNMTSGIPTSAGWTREDISRKQLIETKSNLILSSPPGVSFQYSNYNYILLGEIIESISGVSFENFVSENILAPLDMNNTFFSLDEAKKNNLVIGHQAFFTFPIPAELPVYNNSVSTAYIISCAHDLINLSSIIINKGMYNDKRIISEKGLEKLITPAIEPAMHGDMSMAYCMGFSRITSKGITTIESTGDGANYHAQIIMYPEQGFSIVQLGNTGGSMVPTHIAPSIGALILDMPTLNPPINQNATLIIFAILVLAILILYFSRIKKHIKILKSASLILKKIKRIIITVFVIDIPIILLIIFGVPYFYNCPWNAFFMFSPDLSVILLGLVLLSLVIIIVKVMIIRKKYSIALRKNSRI